MGTAGAIKNSYSTSGNNHAQIVVMPQFTNVTVSSGATLSTAARRHPCRGAVP